MLSVPAACPGGEPLYQESTDDISTNTGQTLIRECASTQCRDGQEQNGHTVNINFVPQTYKNVLTLRNQFTNCF